MESSETCMILQSCIHDVMLLSKPIEYKVLRVNHDVNCRLWMICKCSLISCNKCITLVGEVDSGGDCAHGGTQCMGNLCSAGNFKLL